jgi:hypothetical protein
MKKLLTLIFALISFSALSQNYVGVTVGNVKSGDSSKKYTFTIDGSDRQVFSSTGVTAGYRWSNLAGFGVTYYDADGDVTQIADGTSGQALTTNGAGVYSFSTVTTSPGGSSGDFQYNNGGVFGGYNASQARTALGGTTIGQNIFTSTNPSAITFGRANSDNTFSWLSASDFRTAIGVPSGSGTANYVTYWTGTNTLAGASSFQFDGSGNVDITGSLDVDQINVNGSVISTPSNVNMFLRPGGTGTVWLDNTTNQIRFGDLATTNILVTVPAPATSHTYTVPDALGNANFALTDVGVANQIPYWANIGKLTSGSTFTYNGSSLLIGNTTNQLVTGTGSNLTTLNFPASSGAVTVTMPNVTTSVLYDGGALGTPASGTVTNLTGTASININGTVGATTPTTGAFTTIAGTSTTLTNTTNQIELGATGAGNSTIINSTAPAADRISTLPDYGANANIMQATTGTFTPSISPNSGSFTTLTYSVQYGRYTRKQITSTIYETKVDISLTISALTIGTASGALTINVPYNSITEANLIQVGQMVIGSTDFDAGYTSVVPRILNNAGVIQLRQLGDNVATASLDADNLTSSSSIQITLTYLSL